MTEQVTEQVSEQVSEDERHDRHDPDERGHFGPYGGRFLPEALIAAMDELATVYEKARLDPDFVDEFNRLLRDYAGRPSLLTEAPRFAEHAGGARIFLKREDLNHTGSHKINNVLGQALLTKRMGKKRVIAETGAGQHGVATATACALMGLDCVVYMGEVLPLEQDARSARVLGQATGVGERRGPSGVRRQQAVQLAEEVGIGAGRGVGGGELVEGGDERLGDEPAAVRAEVAGGVGAGEGVGGDRGHESQPRAEGWLPAVTSSATAARGSPPVTTPSPTRTASAPQAA